jgi:hypothetical protein
MTDLCIAPDLHSCKSLHCDGEVGVHSAPVAVELLVGYIWEFVEIEAEFDIVLSVRRCVIAELWIGEFVINFGERHGYWISLIFNFDVLRVYHILELFLFLSPLTIHG